MGCNCGKSQIAAEAAAPAFERVPETMPEATYFAQAVSFVYVGPTALTAQGPFTRMRYRFAHTGAVVDVDGRDAPAMAGIASLKRVSRPVY